MNKIMIQITKLNYMIKKIYTYWKVYGTMRVVKRTVEVIRNGMRRRGVDLSVRGMTVNEAVNNRFLGQNKLPVYYTGSSIDRITLVTDSLRSSSFFGGVATALIFAVLLSEKTGRRLRIITRTESGGKNNFLDMLDREGLVVTNNVEFVHVDIRSDKSVANVHDDELFITTSWWTTLSVKNSVPVENIIYILQEDERMFYPHGDEHLRCTEVLRLNDINILINTKLLYDHFVNESFDNIKENGVWFEPSFSKLSYCPDFSRESPTKLRLFFYSRPGHPRNLYVRGIEALDNAILTGAIDLDEWEIYFIGSNAGAIEFTSGYKPVVISNMAWKDYTTFLQTVDLGLTLMYTPHPSYPPFDLAASGSVVVTNKFGNKTTLENYSSNILCSGLDVDSLTETLARGASLAKDRTLREKNYSDNDILRDWEESFGFALSRFVK